MPHLPRCLVFFSLAGLASAADVTWSGATNATWSTDSNWSGGVAPSFADTAHFGSASTHNLSISLDGFSSIVGLAVDNGLPTGSVITLADGGGWLGLRAFDAGTTTTALSTAFTLNFNCSFDIDAAGTSVINGAAGSSVNLNPTASATWMGGLHIGAGNTVDVKNTSMNLDSTAAHTVNGTLKASGGDVSGASFTGSGALQVSSGRTLTWDAGSASYSGTLSGAGTFLKSGASGTATLTGNNSGFTGVVQINGTAAANKVITGHANALGGGAVSVSKGTLQVGDGTVNSLNLGSTLTLNGSAANIAVLDLRTAGANAALSLANTNGATVDFVFTTGTWKVRSAGATPQINLNGGTYSLGSSITLDLGNAFNSAGTYDLISGTGTAKSLTGSNLVNANTAAFSYAINTSGDLVVTAIPEPTGYVGAVAAGLVFAVRRRRRR